MDKKNKIRFISHASISIEINESELLLCDPWYEDGIFNDSWTLLEKPSLDNIDFSKLRHIWISHEHPDHFHPPTLKKIREKIHDDVTVYFHKEDKQNLKETLEKYGFNFVWLNPHQEVEIAPGFFLNSFPTGIDSAVVIRTPNCVILNQNDCQLEKSEVKAIQRRYPKIDAWFFQFSLAGYYANHDDPNGLQAAKEKHLNLIRQYYEAFKPHTFVPFASFVAFSKEGNAYLNNWRVTLDDLLKKLLNMPVQILWSGDVLLLDSWEERTKKNLELWKKAYEKPIEIRKHPSVDESELEDAGKKMVQKSVKGWASLFCPPQTHLQIRETGRAAIIDFKKKQFRIEEKPQKDKLAGILPAEELLLFLKFPWGADTLNITSCFYVVNPLRWKRLMYYKEFLYRKRPLSKVIKKIFS